MSRTDTWMPLFIGDYLADTMHLEGPEHGAYLLLIMHYWRCGPLPDDDKALAAVARTGRKEWAAGIGSVVRGFFTIEDGRLHHKRIDLELEKAAGISAKRRDAARSRHGTSKANVIQNDQQEDASGVQMQSNSYANAHANAEQLDTHAGACPSALPSPSPKEEKKEDLRSSKETETDTSTKKVDLKGARLADDWNPGLDGGKFARGLGLDPEWTFGKFRDYWTAQPGERGRKKDWPATWRNWCRNEAERKGSAPSLPVAPSPSNPGGHTFTHMTGNF